MADLFKKYDVPAPRYTSFPTVPYWSKTPTVDQWYGSLTQALQKADSSWSMYLHVPYCEKLCTYCGCNTVITRNHEREKPYVDMLLKEWKLYLKNVPAFQKKNLKQLHIGGGTPTFLSAENLKYMISEILKDCQVSTEEFEGSLEVDPRVTDKTQLAVLKDLGFRRVSMGVQDFDDDIQAIINRFQTYEQVEQLVQEARELGYESVNFDLIYGLPLQNIETIEAMMEKTIRLRPDRIAFYSFALVPWIKPQQRRFTEDDLPKGEEKRKLYERGRELLTRAGYVEIGMDHFALPSDSLFKSAQEGKLHRNFMGYTEVTTDVLLGLGVSSISETPDCYHQNEKAMPVYERLLENNQCPTLRGHVLDAKDLEQKRVIWQLMTKFKITLDTATLDRLQEDLREYLSDGVIEIEDDNLKITDLGHPFVRNVCMVFDEYLREHSPNRPLFSKSL